MTVSRRTMLGVGAAVVAGAVANTTRAAAHATVTPAPNGPWISAASLGIAPTNSAAANRAALLAALSDSAISVYLPGGDYRVDNDGAGLVIPSFTGELAMAADARFVFTDNSQRALEFRGGAGARFTGLTTAFVTTPTTRVPARECVLFDGTTDTHVENVRVTGSAAAGLLFYRCVRPTAVDVVITGTMADGLHFANCQDGRADRVTTVDTGDDGVAFLNYASGPAGTGGLATNLSVTRSKSRGVSVVGQSGVTVRDVVIDTTAGPGVLCAEDTKWATRVPDDVVFERIRISGGGRWVVDGLGGTNAGLRISGSGRVSAAGITVDAPGTHGVHAQGNATVTLVDTTVTNAPGSGVLLQGGAHVVERLTVSETDGIGFNVNTCDRLDFGMVTVRNAARTHATHRAVNVEKAGRVLGTRLWIHDTRAAATGYVLGLFGAQTGTLGTVTAQIDHGRLVVDNPSGLAYTLV
jgi:hypothetical protein